MNPNDPQHLSRLQKAVDWARWKLQPFRVNRLAMLREYAGDNYGENGAMKRVMLNMLKLSATIYQRQLVPRNPSAMVASQYPQLKPVAKGMELWMNERIRQIRLSETLRRAVLDALFGVAIVKVGLCVYDTVQVEGWTHDTGEPFADLIDLDDWVHDVRAKRWDQVGFCGHRYCMPLDWCKDNDYFDKEAREKLGATRRTAYNERGDERIGTLTVGSDESWEDEIDDMVELWEIWLPREKLLITMPAGEGGEGISGDKALRIVEWAGPESGPFHMLGFTDIPGQILPAGPMQDLYNFHLLINRLLRKLADQAERQKTIFGVPTPLHGDGLKVLATEDGGTIPLDNPELLKEIKFGGIDQANFAFVLQLKQLIEYAGGNLGAIGGLGPQAETLGQDKLIQTNSSKMMQEMTSRVIEFSRSVYRSLAYYWWTDKVTTYSVERKIPGTSITYQHKVKPKQRQASFLDLNFDIDPYSMQDDTPSSRMQALQGLLQQIIMPLAQQLQQQGMAIAFEPLLRKLAHYANMPDLDEIIQFSTPPTEAGPYESAPSRDDLAPMPQNTNRTYTRVGKPGMNGQGQEQQAIQALMSNQNGQPAPIGGASGQ